MKKQSLSSLTKFYKMALENIASEIRMYDQWDSPDTIVHKYEHYMKLKALVELVETWDCGSVGGFGKGQNHDVFLTVIERANWLLDKYYEGKRK